MAQSSLLTIQQKVRRLTRSLTQAILTDVQLNQYINTYVLYDFPETLRLFNMKKTFSFYTTPHVDVYSTTTNPNSPLYDFTNKYTTTDLPIYIAGYSASFYQSREQFFGVYPKISSVSSIGSTGNGTTLSFSGVINSLQSTIPSGFTQQISLLQNNVLFSSTDVNGNGLAMADSPILDSVTGLPTIFGQLYNALTTQTPPTLALPTPYQYQAGVIPLAFQPGFPLTNYINYVTGEYVVTFATAPASGVTIDSQTVPQNSSRPHALLFFDGEFTVRPVPDQPYKIEMEVFAQPTELLSNGQTPELSEWFQLIAFNAAKKIFEDRMDYDSVNMIMPSLKEQERLVNRRTIVQQTNQRGSTIYTAGSIGGNDFGYNNNGGSY